MLILSKFANLNSAISSPLKNPTICFLIHNVRFTPGDHPELQFESGNSIGGSYPCVCGCHVEKFHDIASMFKHQSTSLEERRAKVIIDRLQF